MRSLEEYQFKQAKKRKKATKHISPVCVVIICNRETGRVERRPFRSWDAAREFVNNREGSRKYRVNIEPM